MPESLTSLVTIRFEVSLLGMARDTPSVRAKWLLGIMTLELRYFFSNVDSFLIGYL